MHRRTGRTGYWRILAATLLAAACSDTAGPWLGGVYRPLLAVGLDSDGGTMGSGSTNVMQKGFNGENKNPRLGSAVVATFIWSGPGTITSVSDRLTNGRPVGNTYHLVESATNGTLSMATYVATNVQNFPSPCCTEAGNGPDTVYVVEAFTSQNVIQQGIIISSYNGVETSFSAAFGPHSSATGTGNTVAPGPVTADGGSLVYGIAIASPVSGHAGPGAPFQLVGSGSNSTTEADARWAEMPSTGVVNPTWDWFNTSANWLATSVVLRAAGGAPPPTGSLAATSSTTGSNLDGDGYTVTVDGSASQALATNGTVTFPGLSAADHSVALSGIANNCTVSGSNPRTVSVPSGGTASTTFSVTCSATTGNLAVSASTTGSNLDPDGYTATVDGSANQAVATNGSVTFTSLSEGSHSVALSGVAGNCAIGSANPQTVNVPSGGTGTASFSITCSATTGNLAVSASTTGSNPDPDGYTATVDGSANQAVAINGSVTFTGLSAGSHSVALSGVAGNCAIGSANPQTVTVPSGGTGTASFSITCSATTGNLTVGASTTGSSLDPDGYTATVDGATNQALAINGSVTFTGLSAGSHNVSLSGVAANCTVSGANPRSVTVPSGGSASTTFTVSCSTPPGNLSVTASTTGSSLDPDGYTATVDGASSLAVATNGSVTFTSLSAGNHSVSLSGVAGNCTVSGSNPRTISVPSGGTGSTTFSVTCSTPPGNLSVTASTTGSSLDPDGYTLTVDGASSLAVATNGSVTFTNLSAGNHSVSLSGVASNCTVSSNPRTISVPSGGTASTTFSVTCTTPAGNLTANTSTTGSSLDPDGYTVMLDGGNARAIGINGTTTYTNLTPGNHSVSLSGVASNCTVSSNPRTISVPSGGTANTTFSVSCVTPNTAPVVNAGPDQTTLTGLLFSESWSFSDPDNGPWNFTIDWGDGTTTSGSKTSAGSFSNGHTYIGLLGAKFTIRITVTDSRGASHTDTAVITIVLL